jgi:hypothetical protein
MKTTTTAIAAAMLLALTGAIATAPGALAAPQPSDPAGRIIAQDYSRVLAATPSSSRAVTVRTEPRAKVTIQPAQQTRTGKAAKTAAQTAVTDSTGIATFSGLVAGQEYLVRSGGEETIVRPVVPVGATKGLTARTTGEPTSVDLTWQHKATTARGGDSITYVVQATPVSARTGAPVPGASAVSVEVQGQQAVLDGLDPRAVYEFSVRAKNALGAGKASIARMSEPLASLVVAGQPATAPTQQQPNVAPHTSPQPTTGPSTRTIYVCPSGYQDMGTNCRKTAPYTFTTRDYTFHDLTQTSPYTYRTVQTGPAPILDSFTTENVCPSGYNLEDYGVQGKFCRLYGPAPTAQVKNDPPAGWTDNGTAYERTIEVKDAAPEGFSDDGDRWVKKDAAPGDWSDDGTQYVHTVAKEARIVPA